MADQHYFQGALQQDASDIEETAAEHGYTDVVFVSPDGNNTDGSTWANAYTTLATAFAAVNTDDNSFTLVNVSAGTHDVNVTGAPTYGIAIHLQGAGKESTIIKNDHGSATAVLKFTKHVRITNMTIDCGTGEDGIVISGTSAHGSEIRGLEIDAAALSTAADGIQLIGGVKYVTIDNVRVIGNVTYTTGIHTSQASYCTFSDFRLGTCLIGIHYDHADDDKNAVLREGRMSGCATGITIDTGITGTKFLDICLHNNTTNVTDTDGAAFFDRVKTCQSQEITKITPETASTGAVVTSAATADSYHASYSQILAGASFTKPYKIVGVIAGNPSDNTATYIIKIATGAGASEVDIGRISYYEGKFGGGGGMIGFNSGWLAAGTRLSANAQTENAVADTIQVWVLYVEL